MTLSSFRNLVLAALAVTTVPARVSMFAASPPDLNGVWVIADSFMDKQDGTHVAAPGRAQPESGGRGGRQDAQPRLKPEFRERVRLANEAAARGTPIEDPTAACFPQGMPRFWIGPYAFEIVQTARQINLYQEWNEQTRRVYLDGRPHPRDADYTYNGHSIGHWEGDVLVVDSVSFDPRSQLSDPGTVHSDAMHIIERLKLVAPDVIEVEMKVEDSKVLEQPWESTRRLRRKPGMEIQPYICAENNRNAPDDKGVTQAVIKAPGK